MTQAGRKDGTTRSAVDAEPKKEPVGRSSGTVKQSNVDTTDTRAPKASAGPHTQQHGHKVSANTNPLPKSAHPIPKADHHRSEGRKTLSMDRYQKFEDVNDDDDAYIPSDSAKPQQSKRKRSGGEANHIKKPRVSTPVHQETSVAENVNKPTQNRSEAAISTTTTATSTTATSTTATTTTATTAEDDEMHKKAPREEPLATRYVFVERCKRCERAGRVCREQYKPGRNGGACYSCSRKRVKCEGDRKGKRLQPVGETEVIVGPVMDEVCQEDPKPQRDELSGATIYSVSLFLSLILF